MKLPSRCNSKRNALTLIEVVVALVLLATLVAGMVTAYSSHHRQALLASKRQAAIQVADRLLSRWYAAADPVIPHNSFGQLPGSLVWRTEVVHQNVIESLPVEVVRLQIFSATALIENGQFAGQAFKSLTQVDVIQPVPESRL